jgi:hypothetical protein
MIENAQDKTKQDKTRQDKTRQDKTRQDKTRQDINKRETKPIHKLTHLHNTVDCLSLRLSSLRGVRGVDIWEVSPPSQNRFDKSVFSRFTTIWQDISLKLLFDCFTVIEAIYICSVLHTHDPSYSNSKPWRKTIIFSEIKCINYIQYKKNGLTS